MSTRNAIIEYEATHAKYEWKFLKKVLFELSFYR
jgi:hypothetical protein